VRAYGFTAIGGPEQEAFLDVPEPAPGPGQLLLQVRAAGVNPGDVRMREGGYGVPPPAVLGREVAGTVIQTGPEVRGFTDGDEVFGGCPDMIGGFAPVALVTASFAAHRPAGLAPEGAATLPVASGTAWDALTGLALPPGATVLVNGAGGGVGGAFVQLAVARGLRVVGVASPGKHDLLAGWGAVPVAYGDGLPERVRAAAPDGIDGLLDMVGGAALRSVAGFVAPQRLRSVADKPLAKQLGGGEVVRDRSTPVLTELARLVADGALDPRVTQVLPFVEAPAAMRAVEAGHTEGKVALALR